MRISITGSVPDGKKSLKSSPADKVTPGAKWEAWRDEAIQAIRRQTQRVRLTKYASIVINYFSADFKRRNPLSIMTAVLYVLREAGLMEHERLFGGGPGTQISFKYCGISGRPRVEIEIMGEQCAL